MEDAVKRRRAVRDKFGLYEHDGLPDICTQCFGDECHGYDGNARSQVEFPAKTRQAAQPDPSACSRQSRNSLDKGGRLDDEVEHIVVQGTDAAIVHCRLFVRV